MLGSARTYLLRNSSFPFNNHVKSITTTKYPKLYAFWKWKKSPAEQEADALAEDTKKGLLSLEDLTSKEPELTEEEILAKRNKSRLKSRHYRMLHDEMPYDEPVTWFHQTVFYKCRTFGKYGEKSGVYPGLLWPTHRDLDKRLEYEEVAYPFTIQEMVAKKKELRRLEVEELERREKEVDTKMGQLEKMKKAIYDKQAAKEKEIEAARAKRAALIEEVRRHFGYDVDPKDEQFQEMIEKKEKAMRKALKEAKKLQKQKMLMAKLTEGITHGGSITPEKTRSTFSSWGGLGEGAMPGSTILLWGRLREGGGGIPGCTTSVVSKRTFATTILSSPPPSKPTETSVGHKQTTTSSSPPPPTSLPIEPHKLVESDLHDLVKDIRKELGGRHLELCDVAAYYFDGQGKAIRPLISILMARAINAHLHGNNSFILLSQKQLALVSEMIHTATLVHDDVIDTSDTRRGKPSVNALFGQKKAIIGGDYILAKAGAMVAGLNNDEVTQILAQVLEDLVQGEFMQMGANEGTTERFTHYIGKTFNKTASLMAYSCKGVAVLGGSDEALADIAFKYGKNVGIAFQLMDDLLDFVSSTATMGKPAAADLQLGLATAPVLYAAQKHSELFGLIERRFSGDGDVEKALDYVHNSDGLEQTKILAQKYCLEAVRAANSLRDSSYRSALITVTEMVLNRSK